MKLCGFEVGLEHPLFIIAGEHRSAEQGPLRGCAPDTVREARVREGAQKAACDSFGWGALRLFPQTGLRLTSRSRTAEMLKWSPRR